MQCGAATDQSGLVLAVHDQVRSSHACGDRQAVIIVHPFSACSASIPIQTKLKQLQYWAGNRPKCDSQPSDIGRDHDVHVTYPGNGGVAKEVAQ